MNCGLLCVYVLLGIKLLAAIREVFHQLKFILDPNLYFPSYESRLFRSLTLSPIAVAKGSRQVFRL